ncbi:MAG TPA: SpoIVB peptidase [Limnochordia bacterium]
MPHAVGVQAMDGVRARLMMLVWCAVLAIGAPPIASALGFPGIVRLFPGEVYSLPARWLELSSSLPAGSTARLAHGQIGFFPTSTGSHRLTLSLFGIPLREARLDVVPPVQVIPGGQAVGVLLSPRGLIVARTASLLGRDGRRYDPAREAGIEPGDVIIEVDGEPLTSLAQLEAAIEADGERQAALPLALRRGGRRIGVRVRPVRAEDPLRGERFLIGVFLEDPAAGIGTLTFWEARTRRYAALGHPIAGPQERTAPVDDGRIVAATIRGVERGERGRPGEKVGVFDHAEPPLGTIEENTPFGIYGHLLRIPAPTPYSHPVTVALAHQVRPGPAEILTVVSGNKVERFQIRILSVRRQAEPDGKGLLLEVTDPALLRHTGGIIQGMSGSPILQDGRLVGAVTHVLINDPTRGFGILAEWMVYRGWMTADNRQLAG